MLSASGERLKITASFGLACFPDDATDKSTLIQMADEALYRSKAAGRNRVSMCEPGSGLNRAVRYPPRPIAGPAQPNKLVATQRKAGVGGMSGMWGAVATGELEEIRRQQRELASEGGEVPVLRPDERRRTALRILPKEEKKQ